MEMGELLGEADRYGCHADVDCVPAFLRQHIAVQHDFPERMVVREHRDECVPSKGVAGGLHDFGAEFGQFLRRPGGTVPNPQPMPGSDQALGNTFAHVSEADKSDFHRIAPY
jgi:hypothetical protein